jgi:hypothetical protein
MRLLMVMTLAKRFAATTASSWSTPNVGPVALKSINRYLNDRNPRL